ncbi:hypothetical protein AAF712_010997 [Marasmius tenuissimus]|uniref:DUF6535 domain-containing protein n=1 Tax=Marasmius tenuissimus TaxID=585030 RepID=A0ABR2ZLH1_9AGAR
MVERTESENCETAMYSSLSDSTRSTNTLGANIATTPHIMRDDGTRNGNSTRIPDTWADGGPYFCSPRVKGDPWEPIMKIVDKYDDEMAKGWREDIDTLLVFAGLFSAAVTAFIIESYQWLKPDLDDDAVIAALSTISRQLRNASDGAVSLEETPFTPSPSAIRINTVWFLSLVMSLSAVLFGILCKQWLREHRHDTHTSTREEAMLLRQLRFDSFEKWGVPTFLAFLPILLEIALILFFAGILDLLWSLHPVPASIATVAVGISVGIYIITTILPTWRAMYVLSLDRVIPYPITICPFKSPQSWLFYVFSLGIVQTLFRDKLYPKFLDWSRSDLHIVRDFFISSESIQSFPYLHRPYRLEGLKWLVETFGDNASLSTALFGCLRRSEHPLETMAYATGLPSDRALDSVYHAFLFEHPDPDIQMFVKELKMRRDQHHAGEVKQTDPLDVVAMYLFTPKGPTSTFYQLAMDAVRSEKQNMDVAAPASILYNTFVRSLHEQDLFEEYKVELAFQCDTLIKSGLEDGNPMASTLELAVFSLCMKLWSHPSTIIREKSISILEDFEVLIMTSSAYAPQYHDLKDRFSEFLAQSLLTTFSIREETVTRPVPVISSARGKAFISFLNDLVVYRGLVTDDALKARWMETRQRLAPLQALQETS